ncbi:MAG: ferredoxin [Armatimonadota bacterium]|nr:ferredoxin [Armatimonadota bacterium]
MLQIFKKLFARPQQSAVPPVKCPRTLERHPLNAPGPFYVVNGDCLTCGLAEAEAPELIESVETHGHCYYKRQPETTEEVEQAIMAMAVSETAAHRYGGNDPVILRRLKMLGCEWHCDQRLMED